MGRLSFSLIGFVLVGLIGLSWLFDSLYQNYHSAHVESETSQPVTAIFQSIAIMADKQNNIELWLADWPLMDQYQLSLTDFYHLALPESLVQELTEGRVLELASDNSLQFYMWLPNTQKLLVMTSSLTNQHEAENDPLRYWITSLFYSLLIGVLMLWAAPLILRLVKLRKVAKAFGDGDLAQRINVGKSSYIRDLEVEFNQMAQRIEDLVADVKLLSSAVSHDLRTPLAKIRMGLDTLSEETDPVKRVGYEERIQQHLDEMVELVEALLSYARLDQARLKLSLQPTDLSTIINTLCERKQASDFNTELNDSAATKNVLVDPFYIKLVFTNLIENAARYGNGKLAISLSQQAKTLAISFEDNGPGIPKELSENICKPFVRGQHKDKQGFGLGLAIVKRILDWHQAELEVGKSNSLGGAKFTVLFVPCSDIEN